MKWNTVRTTLVVASLMTLLQPEDSHALVTTSTATIEGAISGGPGDYVETFTVSNRALLFPIASFYIPELHLGDIAFFNLPENWAYTELVDLYQGIEPNLLKDGSKQAATVAVYSTVTNNFDPSLIGPGESLSFTAHIPVGNTIAANAALNVANYGIIYVDLLIPDSIPEPWSISLLGAAFGCIAIGRRSPWYARANRPTDGSLSSDS